MPLPSSFQWEPEVSDLRGPSELLDRLSQVHVFLGFCCGGIWEDHWDAHIPQWHSPPGHYCHAQRWGLHFIGAAHGILSTFPSLPPPPAKILHNLLCMTIHASCTARQIPSMWTRFPCGWIVSAPCGHISLNSLWKFPGEIHICKQF